VHEYAADTSALSLWWFDSQGEFPGSDKLFPGGYSQIPNILAEGLDIRLSSPVASISYDPTGATVTTTGGTSFSADYVVVSVPLGVLKAGDIAFTPPLPEPTASAVGLMEMGLLDKYVLIFQTVFWDDVTFINFASNTNGYWPQILNLDKAFGTPGLMVFAAGSFAQDASTAYSDAQAEAAILAELRIMYGNAVPTSATSFVRTDWSHDEYAWGSYSFQPVGFEPLKDYGALQDVISGRLLLAGEHTDCLNPATVHGAYESGQRVADAILQGLAVGAAVPQPVVCMSDVSTSASARLSLFAVVSILFTSLAQINS